MTENRTAAIGGLLTALGPLSMSIFTPIMPQLVDTFDTSKAVVSMALSAYFAGFAFSQLIAGALSDVWGRRRTSVIFLSLYLAGGIAASLAPGIEWLISARLLQGVGASVGVVVARALVRDQFQGRAAERVMNSVGIAMGVAPAFGPFIGGMMGEMFGWQAAFLAMILIGLVALFAVLAMPETATLSTTPLTSRRLIGNYVGLLFDIRFLLPALASGGAVGTLFAQASMLPYILIDIVGLSPTQFGAAMLVISASYFAGALSLRSLSRLASVQATVRFGLILCGSGAILIILFTRAFTPSVVSILSPLVLTASGIAILTPRLVILMLSPYPDQAGSSAALAGALQMGLAFIVTVASGMFGSLVAAFGTLIPLMICSAIAVYGIHRAQAQPEGRQDGNLTPYTDQN